MKHLFRTVVRNVRTQQTEIILEESTDFAKCLKAARAALDDGIDASKIDILALNQIELWSSVWTDDYPMKGGSND